MLEERMVAIREELDEVESLQELKAIWCHWQHEVPEVANDGDCSVWVKRAVYRLKLEPPANDDSTQLSEQLQALKAQLESVMSQIKTKPTAKVDSPVPSLQGIRQMRTSGIRYQLLKTDVSWTSTPQVHAIVRIISSHINVGDVVTEDEIVQMMESNREALCTRQLPKRIWDYYKGEHDRGLIAHGNLKRV